LTIDAVLLKSVAAQVRNLSAGGCLLELRSCLPVGSIGVLDMEFDGKRCVEWFRICRIQSIHGRSGAYTVGAEFLPLAAAGDNSLRGAVRRMGHVDTAHKISRLTGRMSGDPGKSMALPAAIPGATDAFPVDLSQQLAEISHAGAGPKVGSPVAESSDADALDSRKSDKGEVHR